MLDRLCPYFMAMGMSCHEFWHGDYTHWKYIEEAWQIKRKQENETLWLQGAYTHHAVGAILASLYREKGKPPVPYLDKPMRIGPMTEEEKKAEEEAEKQKQIENFRAALNTLNHRFEAKHQRERG